MHNNITYSVKFDISKLISYHQMIKIKKTELNLLSFIFIIIIIIILIKIGLKLLKIETINIIKPI